MSIPELFASINASEGPTVATVGTFDGVHLGHRALLQRVRQEAEARSAKSVAIVFKGQPRALIRPDLTVTYLSDLDTRRTIITDLGIDQIIELEFKPEIRQLTSSQFVTALRERIGLQALIVGPGALIGSDRAGAKQLASAPELNEIDFIDAPLEVIDGHEVSSSAIRRAIKEGNCEIAASMLGRNYSISGNVATGEKRGRTLGFPTANVEPEISVTVPQNGIYATHAEVDGVVHQAATSIGTRPTFEQDGGRTIEAFLLDFDGDLYNKRLRLEFITRLRSEAAFDSVELLIEQMNEDVEQTRQILAAR